MVRRGATIWTDEQLNYLIKNATTMSSGQIAKELRLSRSAVCGKAWRMGLSFVDGMKETPPPPPEPAPEPPPPAQASPARAPAAPSRLSPPLPPPTLQPLGSPAGGNGVESGPGVVVVAGSAAPGSGDGSPVTILELEDRHCRWPLGLDPVLYCGAPRLDNRYCKAHADLSRGERTPSKSVPIKRYRAR